MTQIPNADLPVVNPQTGRINLEWYAALTRIAAGALPYGVYAGDGAPTFSAPKGAIYIRNDGSGVNNRAYINTDGATTWTAMVTVA
jgi:hypothetical protein